MFGALRQGSIIYILDKQNALDLKVGSVVSTTQPTGYNMIPFAQNLPGQTIDIVVKYDDGTTNEFKQMQFGSSVAYYGNTIVTETKEQMMAEVDTIERNSQTVLDTIPYHRAVIDSIPGVRSVLSPSYAKEKQTDERLVSLEQGLGDIRKDQKDIMDLLSKIASGASSKSTNKT